MRSGKENYWTGDAGRQFEMEFADASASKHAVAVANGTVALELALQALGIGQGDGHHTMPVVCRIRQLRTRMWCGARPAGKAG